MIGYVVLPPRHGKALGVYRQMKYVMVNFMVVK